MVRVEYFYVLLLAVLLFEFLYREISGQVLVLIGVGLLLIAALGEQVSGNGFAERVGNFAYLTITAGVLVMVVDHVKGKFRSAVAQKKSLRPREESKERNPGP